MSRSPRVDQLHLFAAVALPGLAVVLARFVGAGASSARADIGLPDAPALPRIDRPASLPEHLASASRRAGEVLAAPAAGSPFAAPSPPAAAAASGATTGSAHPQPAGAVEPPPVRLGAIYVVQRRPIAVIDDRLVRVGQPVAEGWTLTAVDPAGRRVTLTHESGAEATFTLHHPGLNGG